MSSYLKDKRKTFRSTDDDDEDLESVCSEDFQEMLNKMSGSNFKDIDDDLDYMNEIGDNLKSKSKKSKLSKRLFFL